MRLHAAIIVAAVVANVLIGNGASACQKYLFGTSGDDTLVAPPDGCDYKIAGFAGNDTLVGNSGQDELFPGTNVPPGKDKMTGGGRTDAFIFDEVSYTQDTGDVITDFTPNVDKIFLYGVCHYVSVTCNYIGSAPFDGTPGEVRYVTTSGNGQVQADLDGDGVADFTLNLFGAPAITGGDISFDPPPPIVGKPPAPDRN